MKKFLTVFGTRPEAIKMAPIVMELKKRRNYVHSAVCVTGQHRKMLDQVLDFFEITPDFDLQVMKENQDLFDITSNILIGMKDVINQYSPDLILVHGDTTTTFAVALAAFYHKIPVAHVEAGLRTWDLNSPWPEECNRQLTDVLTNYYFAPTGINVDNLLKEGRNMSNVFNTGNTVIDSLRITLDKIFTNPELKDDCINKIKNCGYTYTNINKKIVLITCHRRENFGEGLENICRSLLHLSSIYSNVDFIFPVHLNPKIIGPVSKIISKVSNIYLIEPLDYASFVFLMNSCFFILSDSGGIQEEAPYLKKPVLLMRDSTERPEAVSAGAVKLVGSSFDSIVQNVTHLLSDSTSYHKMCESISPYGDGFSGVRIVDILIGLLNQSHPGNHVSEPGVENEDT